MSFAEIAEKYWKDLREGKTVDCPCCGRYSHFNKFKITQNMIDMMAKCLQLQEAMETGFVHHTRFLTGETRGFYNLKRFNMIEQQARDKNVGHASGLWRVTVKGKAFLLGEVSVPKYALVFDDEVMGFDGDLMDVHQCYEQHFNYFEVVS